MALARSCSTKRLAAAGRSFHHPSGRLPITLATSTSNAGRGYCPPVPLTGSPGRR